MGRIALVTGANRGIGFEACRQLPEYGFRVILTARNVAKGEQAAEVLAKKGKAVDFLPLDVTDDDSVSALVNAVDTRYGRLDVLVNNAAVYLDEGVSAFDVPIADIQATMDTNVYGPWRMCRAFMPRMNKRGYGRIVNVSSEMGSLHGMEGRTAAYRVSKTALNALTRSMAAEARGDVKINSMCPGWVRTDMGGPDAPRDVVDAVDTLIWLATLPKDGPNGGFFQDRRTLAW